MDMAMRGCPTSEVLLVFSMGLPPIRHMPVSKNVLALDLTVLNNFAVGTISDLSNLLGISALQVAEFKSMLHLFPHFLNGGQSGPISCIIISLNLHFQSSVLPNSVPCKISVTFSM